MVVLITQVYKNRSDEFNHGREKLVGTGRILQVSPEPFDRVQDRAVGRQKEWLESSFDCGKTSGGNGAPMIRSVVQDKQDWFVVRRLLDQHIQEGNEGITVLLDRRHGNHFISDEVIGAKEMMPFLLTRRINPSLLTSFHPASTEDWMQT